MPIPIPIGWDFEVTVAGQRMVEVSCERCVVDYLFVMDREAKGASRAGRCVGAP